MTNPKLTAALVAVAALLCACNGDAPSRPNVLMVVIDTCRGDRCGFNGYADGTTPALDAFAADAVTFTDAWSPACWTAPAHASLFTGARPPRHGLMEGNRTYLDATLPTLAERLGASGYRTAMFSNNPVVSPTTRLVRGFEHFEPMFETAVAEPVPTSRPTHERMLAWIRRQTADDTPWFAFVNHMEPHLPYWPPEAVRDRRTSGVANAGELAWANRFGQPVSLLPALGVPTVDARQAALLSRLYDGEIETVDAELGRFLAALRDAGVLDTTLVVLLSDHGENLGDHGLFDHRMSLNRSLLRVPLVVRLPGVFDGGRVVTDVVRVEDVPITVLDVCGLEPLPEPDGASLRGDVSARLARGAHGTLQRMEASVAKNFPSVDTRRLTVPIRSVYDGRHHLIAYGDGRVELFDVEQDPGETSDLSGSLPDVVARLRPLCDPF